jgi:hypothetical protein
MNTPFAQALERWHDFYLLAGGAAATLIGLLFIAASLHPEMFADGTASRARLAAAQALSNFFVVLAVALVFLMPDQTPQTSGIVLLIIAILGLMRLGSIALQQRRGQIPGEIGSLLVYYYVLPFAYSVSMLYVAVTLWTGDSAGMGWLVWVVISILIGATATAWSMLTQLSSFGRDSAKGKP